MDLFNYKVLKTRVIDGDTVDVTIDLGFKVNVNVVLRMSGYDAPELRTSSLIEKEAALRVLAFLEGVLLRQANNLFVRSAKIPNRADIYDRYSAELFYFDTDTRVYHSINDMVLNFMINYGLTKAAIRAKELEVAAAAATPVPNP